MQWLKHSWLTVGTETSLCVASALLGVVLDVRLSVAQPAYGSYVGIGPAIGLSEDDNGDGSDVAGAIAVRYKLLELPISFRGQAFINDGSFAIVPTVSYDYPINWQTDVYLGAGIVIPGGDRPSTVGDRIGFAIQPGVDYAIPNSNMVIFGNAIFAFDGYEKGDGTAISVQGGIGFRF